MEMMMKRAGSCGRYQVYHVILTQLPRFSSVWAVFLMLIGSYDPGWRCLDRINQAPINNSELMNYNSNFSNKLQFHEFFESTGHSKDGSDIFRALNETNQSFEENESEKYSGTCDEIDLCNQIEFRPGSITLVTRFELICDKSWAIRFIFIILGAGYFTGPLVSGFIGERYGRKIGLYSFTSIMCLFTGLAIFSPHWIMYAVCSFFISVGVHGVISLSNVFSMEFLSSKWRGYFGALPIWTISTLLCTIVTRILKNWVHVHAVTFLMTLMSCVGVFIVPDSPRWLMQHGQTEKAKKVFQKIAKINRKPDPTGNLVQLEELQNDDCDKTEKDNNNYSYIDLLRSQTLNVYTLKLCLVMGVFPLGYYGLGYGIQSLEGDFYINAIISSSCDIVGLFLAGVITNRVGRKCAGITMSAIGAVCSISVLAVLFGASGTARSEVIKISTFLAKAVSMGIFSVTVLLVVELFPTVVRNLALGLVRCTAGVAALLAPFIIPSSTDRYSVTICFSVLGASFLLNIVVFLTLPETNKQYLKDSLHEAVTSSVIVMDKESDGNLENNTNKFRKDEIK